MFALEGTRIVDLTNYIAGGYASGLLASLGADVIKVESHEGDPFRFTGSGWLTWNANKRGIIVDLKKPEGKEILFKLVEGADAVMENFRPGVAERLGIGYEDLKKINPRLVYGAVSAWGQSGPYAQWPGFDPLLQAMGGVMANQGGPEGDPVFLRVAVSDYGSAFLGALAVAAALYVREKTGIAQKVETSLLNAVIAMQASSFMKFETPPSASRGSAPYQLFRTSNHWIFVACGNNNFWKKYCKAIGREDLTDHPRFATVRLRAENKPEIIGILEKIMLTKTTDEWVSILREADVPCAPVRTMDQVFHDPQVLHNEMIVEQDHPEFGRYWHPGAPIKFSVTPERGKAARAPLHGEHTVEVLTELGYSAEQMEDLKKKKII